MTVQALTERNMQNRKTNSRKFYELMTSDKIEFTVTLDEAKVYLIRDGNQTSHCYLKYGQGLPDSCLIKSKEGYPTGMMVVAGMTGRGPLPLLRIPNNAKINADNYVDYVLRPYFEKYLPDLYPGEMSKLLFHHDKASSHTSHLAAHYLEMMRSQHGLTFLSKEDIPVKGPDISPLDFYGFGFLKQKSKKCRATTLQGLWLHCKKVWSEVTPEICRDVFKSWKVRLRYVSRNNGGHIEHLKKIHRRSIKN